MLVVPNGRGKSALLKSLGEVLWKGLAKFHLVIHIPARGRDLQNPHIIKRILLDVEVWVGPATH